MGDGKLESLLIVEDDPALQKQIRWSFSQFNTVAAGDRESAIALVLEHSPAVVTMDLGLPPDPDSTSEGFLLLQQIMELAPETKIIVVTGQNDHANALRAVELGAYDFIAKPFESDILSLIVERAFKLHGLQAENRRLRETQREGPFPGLITGDPEMIRVCRTLEKVGNTTATVLLLGESGTGKELLARGVHEASPRRRRRMVAINCAAIPETLLESELFGYEKGAFTGAVKTTLGKIETAQNSTLMLDEIGDLPMSLQAKLLRFLQERVIERVGGRQEIPVNVRIVCATHQDLGALIKEGRFREDLYYRLAEIAVTVPPLRARPGDPSLLAHAFVRRFAGEQKRGTMSIDDAALAAIDGHSWPGNVRELENCIKRAVIMADGNRISVDDVGLAVPPAAEQESLDLRVVRGEAERVAVIRALGRANGNIARAAELLGISRPTLYDIAHRFAIQLNA